MEQNEIDKAYAEMDAYLKGIAEHNEQFLKKLGKRAQKDFVELIESCNVTEKIKFVDTPKGRDNNENFGIFKNVHVDEWSTGTEGDSYEGYIYANVKGQWIEVPYEC